MMGRSGDAGRLKGHSNGTYNVDNMLKHDLSKKNLLETMNGVLSLSKQGAGTC